jgi:hypothetical protein
MMQIVKHNSISGCKLASTRIVYTPHFNLKKTFDMESGTVTYHDTKLCRYKRCDKDKIRVKELEKTKIERLNVDFFEEMKANERRIIERKRRERMESHADSDELYDPIKEDLRIGRIRASRQGDDESGLDKGLSALEDLSLSTAKSIATTGTNAHDVNRNDSKTSNASPVWVNDVNSRMLLSPDVRFLRARGYTTVEAESALASKKSCIQALQTLWRGAGILSSSYEITQEVAQARMEEKEVLQAIFGEDNGVTLSDDDAKFDAIFPITSYEPPSRYGLPPPLLLEVYVDDDIAPLYPSSEPPVLALVGGGLPETLLKELTNQLRDEALKRAKEEPGDPQIFNFLGFVGEEAEKIIEKESAELEVERKKRLEEERAQLEMKRKEEAERKREEGLDQAPPQATWFKSEEERRAYAKEVLLKANCLTRGNDDSKDNPGGERFYDTGVSDQDLINDLF